MPISSVHAAVTAGTAPAAPVAEPEAAAVSSSHARRKAATPSGATSRPSTKTSTTPSVIASLARSVLGPRGDLTGLLRVVTRAASAGRGSSAAGWATLVSKSSDLAFLKDPKLSLDEKLIKLLGVLNARWDKELQDKLDRMAAGEKTTSTSSSTKSKPKGLLGGLASAFSSALGGAGKALDFLKIPAVKTALKKLGGPVLAAAASALGFPAAAPALLKYGPEVVNAALGVASAAGGSAAKTSQSTSSAGALSDSDRQTLMAEIQHIRQKQQEMFTLVSNILKAGHDTRLAIIGNVR